MKKKALNQREFAQEISRSQAQVSKYLSGNCEIPGDVIIRCSNIIMCSSPEPDNHIELLLKVNQLQGDEHLAIRRALMGMINAWQDRKH
ncbi:hypothetical protein D3C76_641630 [compost metagenome]